jgi:hypothetical protein
VTQANKSSPSKKFCCRVTGDYQADPPICDFHVLDGWYMTTDFKGNHAPDAKTVSPCGCAWGTLYQHKIITCATHVIGPLACCPRATALKCVCAYAYSCPDHGERHNGTHD